MNATPPFGPTGGAQGVGGPVVPAAGRDRNGLTARTVGKAFDAAQRSQAGLAQRYVAKLRADHPGESPAQLVARIEKHFLHTVTATGAGTGAAAALPGVGTIAAMAALAGETAVFFDAAAFFALALAEVYGITPREDARRSALILTVCLGEAGLETAGAAIGAKAASLRGIAKGPVSLPSLNGLNKRLMQQFVKRLLRNRAPLVFGKLLPAGIGAVVGGIGNRALGRVIVDNARSAYGPPPRSWAHLTVVDGTIDPGSAWT